MFSMSILKVARMGHPVLRAPARPVEPSEITRPSFQTLITDMFETMNEYQGVGLAAPQVHEGLRLFVAGFEEPEQRVPLITAINPEIVAVGRDMDEDWEGCLSIPDVRGRVPRHRVVQLRALDRRGKRFELTLEGFAARVVQHETDHLNGVLFLDRMKSFESLAFMEEFTRYWSRESVAAE
jgi:peptide deformylase